MKRNLVERGYVHVCMLEWELECKTIDKQVSLSLQCYGRPNIYFSLPICMLRLITYVDDDLIID